MKLTIPVAVLLAMASFALAAPEEYTGGFTFDSKPLPMISTRIETTANEDDCECVLYYLCKNGTILTKGGADLFDVRLGGAMKSKSKCTNYMQTCCKSPDVVSRQEKLTPVPRVRKGCGQRNPDGVSVRITGQPDNQAQFAEYPWMVVILRDEVNDTTGMKNSVYQCGGSLINTRAVLTAAHCVNGQNGRKKQPSQLKARAGEWDTQTTDELFPYQEREVASVIVHENFSSGTLVNDIAILILKEPIELAENIDFVCLPQPNENFDKSRCIASGWGKDTFGKEGHFSAILKAIELPVVSHDACQKTMRTTRLGPYFILDPSFMCAGGELGKDTCKGDGGSPLVCPLKTDRSRYAQVGIVSWGIGCGENQVPSVFANIPAFREWIDKQMVSNNLDLALYQT